MFFLQTIMSAQGKLFLFYSKASWGPPKAVKHFVLLELWWDSLRKNKNSLPIAGHSGSSNQH